MMVPIAYQLLLIVLYTNYLGNASTIPKEDCLMIQTASFYLFVSENAPGQRELFYQIGIQFDFLVVILRSRTEQQIKQESGQNAGCCGPDAESAGAHERGKLVKN
jgi:hypothetical protein